MAGKIICILIATLLFAVTVSAQNYPVLDTGDADVVGRRGVAIGLHVYSPARTLRAPQVNSGFSGRLPLNR